eukprot:12677142-Alexandrium_andersonii.AAC.1
MGAASADGGGRRLPELPIHAKNLKCSTCPRHLCLYQPPPLAEVLRRSCTGQHGAAMPVADSRMSGVTSAGD